jgi:Aminotransferase class I and II
VFPEGPATERTRVVFLNNASFPSGWVASDEEWDAIASICRERDLWLLYFAGYEGVLFDGRPIRHPAALAGMRDRTVTVGARGVRKFGLGEANSQICRQNRVYAPHRATSPTKRGGSPTPWFDKTSCDLEAEKVSGPSCLVPGLPTYPDASHRGEGCDSRPRDGGLRLPHRSDVKSTSTSEGRSGL